MLRPSTARGMPALGIAASGRVVAVRMASIAVSTVAGPVEQLTPIASAPHSVSSAAACAGEDPSRQLLSSSTVTMTSTGRSGAVSRAATSASRASFRAGMVSMISKSTPAPGQRGDLFSKGRAGFVEPGLAKGFKTNPKRPYGSGHPGLARLLVFEMFDGLAGQLHARGVDLGDFLGQSMPG